MAFYIDGVPCPGDGFVCDYKKKHYVSAYRALFDSIQNKAAISRDEFEKGYNIYCFNISGTNSRQMNLLKRGHSRLSIRFDQALKESVTLITYASFEKVLEIDQSRSVIIK